MKTLEKLRADLKVVVAETKALVDAADKNNGEMTAEQDAKYEELTAQFDKLNAAIDKQEKMASMISSAEEGTGRVTEANQTPKAAAKVKVDAEKENYGFNNLADFAVAVQGACAKGGVPDQRLQAMQNDLMAAPSNFHREGGSDEGYMVPPAMRAEIWANVYDGTDFLNEVTVEPTSSNTVSYIKDESTPYGTTGIQANWEGEGEQLSASKLATKEAQLKLNKLNAFVLATDELKEDAPRLANRLMVGASQAIRYKASDAIVNGNGVGKPLGFMASDALVSVAKESGQTADTVVAKNVLNMYARMINPGRANWYINQDVLPTLVGMTIGDKPVWMPPNGLADAPGGFLFGRPVKFSEHNATVGDLGDITFVNPDGYYAVQKQTGLQFANSIHLFFDYSIEAFRWTFRFGGRPFLSAPVSPAKGSSTRSHFVALAAR